MPIIIQVNEHACLLNHALRVGHMIADERSCFNSATVSDVNGDVNIRQTSIEGRIKKSIFDAAFYKGVSGLM